MFAVSELSTDVLQQALRAGARDAVVIGGEASLHQSVDRVGELLAGSVTRSTRQTPATRTGEPGRLIVVFSPKGGVGKTCIAINVAVAMAKRSADPVVLVDGDLQFGDVSVMLGLPPQHTVLDAAAAAQYGDMELVQSLAARHDERPARAARADRADADRRAAAGRDGEHLPSAAGGRRPRHRRPSLACSTTTCSP